MAALVRVGCGVALVAVLLLVPAAAAQSDKLQAGIELFERQEYVAAQEALLRVDREALAAGEREQLDQLLALIPEAIKANEKGRQDLAAADEAYQAGNWDAADRQYVAVCENKYALAAGRTHAAAQRARIAEKKKLAEAAKPSGAVEERVVIERVEEEPPPAEPVRGVPEPAPTPAPPAVEAPADEGPRRLTPTDELQLRDRLLWQRAAAQAQTFRERTLAAVAAHDFVEARRLADSALQTVEAAAGYAEPVAVYEQARQELVALKAEVEQQQRLYDEQQAATEQQEIAQRIAARRELLEQQKREKIQQLFNSADQLRREQRFGEAAEVLRQILRIDPVNARARYQLEVAEDYESFAAQRDWYEELGVQQRRTLLKAEESLIPWDYDVLYPKNWRELTARRSLQGVAGGSNFADQQLQRKLDEPLAEVRFDEQPLEKVFEYLAGATDVNIAVDWSDLNAFAIAPTRPVSLRLANVALRTVLREVLTQVGGETQLAFAVGDGLLRVATKEKLDRQKATLIYDVRDLLVQIPQARQPDFDRNALIGADSGRRTQLFEAAPYSPSAAGGAAEQASAASPDDPSTAVMEKIKQIIRQTVEPDSWLESGAGAGGGSIQDLNGNLIIYNTSEAHRQVVNVLGQLRETQALQISVESRFLDVVSNFLEQFGVDLDFVFNSGSAGYDRANNLVDPFTGAPVLIPRQYSRIGAYPATPPFGQALGQDQAPQQPYGHAGFVPPSGGVSPHIDEMTPILAQQGSLSMVDPTGINTGVPGSWAQRSGLAPALNIAGSFLDNLQVDFLIRATQANQRSSVLQAPRAVMMNGQAVEIRIEGVRRYISSLEPVVGENVALPRPVPADATSGISMWVFGVISADRRYTTLSISLLNQSEPTFDRYELQRGSGNSPSIYLLLPSFSRITYSTTVTIPDGGTVLLGGFKQIGEVEVEAGVPILSKIPILKRAFTNQTTVKDTRTLLILLKSKIIIQKEAEEEAFPTFSQLGT